MTDADYALGLIDTSGHWLDYKVEYENPDANPPEKLIRFIPIEQLMAILTTKTLHFPCATAYEDPLECVYSADYCSLVYDKLLETADEPEFSLSGEVDHYPFIETCQGILEQRIHKDLASNAERWFVSCWHSGSIETELLWRAYGGHNGVALACDGAKLAEQIVAGIRCSRGPNERGAGQDHIEIHHGFVRYKNTEPEIEGDGPTVRIFSPAFLKNEYFRLDNEYRFAVYNKSEDPYFLSADATIDLEACDTQILTSPLCTPWISSVIHRVVNDYAPKIKIERLFLE